MAATFNNILIIKPSSLGDVVLALPALSALRRNFSDANISWLVRPEFAPILEDHPHLTEVIPFDRKFLGKAWYNPRALACLVHLIRRLRRSKFDAVIDLQGLLRTALLGWLTGSKKRFGMAKAREFAHVFYTHKIAQTPDCIHLVDYYLKMVSEMGASDLRVEFVFPQNAPAMDSVCRLLAQHKVSPGIYVVLVPGSARSEKCWPVERFAQLADRIAVSSGLPIIASGVASEGPIVDQLRSMSRATIVNFAGRTSANELVALLKMAGLVVSNDTGPGHIAAALGTPVVLIFGLSNPARVAPYGRPECIVAREPFSRGFIIDSTEPRHDIKLITVDEVYEKVREQMRIGDRT
jgi:lipopolysaccharide heptosyltransferase I